jgi:y4mF family transcriptional regulator
MKRKQASGLPRHGHKPPVRDKALARFVRDRRKAAGLTQRQLSELAGVGHRAIWDLERGKPTLRMDVANAVLRVFGKTLGVVEGSKDLEGAPE